MKGYGPGPALHSGMIMPPRSVCAPPLLVAYAIGATLWTPLFVLVAGPFESVLALALPGLAQVGAVRLFVAIWVLRVALYTIGAGRGWDYGYGVNGVIVNRHLPLKDKLRRIARDWFGLVLGAVWIGFMAMALIAMVAAR